MKRIAYETWLQAIGWFFVALAIIVLILMREYWTLYIESAAKNIIQY